MSLTNINRMEFNSYLRVFLSLAVLLYSPAEAVDATTCTLLTPCLQYAFQCFSRGVRNVCLFLVDNTVAGCGVTNADGLQGLCAQSSPSIVQTKFFSSVCHSVEPNEDAIFYVDQVGGNAADGGDDGMFPISPEPLIFGTGGPVNVQCDLLPATPCPGAQTDSFKITIPTGACDCTCTDWGDSTDCSVTCGTGSKTQTRTCTSATDGTCIEIVSQIVPCTTTTACPSCTCTTEWTNWAACSVTCGGGTRTRSQPCVSTNGDGSCDPQAFESEACNTESCGLDGGWAVWGNWGSCVPECTGDRQRERVCNNPLPTNGGADCEGTAVESGPCPIDTCSPCTCQNWGSWGACTKTCGGGTQMRLRTCTGTDCPKTTKVRDCNESHCPSGGYQGRRSRRRRCPSRNNRTRRCRSRNNRQSRSQSPSQRPDNHRFRF